MHLPLMMNRSRIEPYFGLAQVDPSAADRTLLGVQWYYYHGVMNDADFTRVPMAYFGFPSNALPSTYSGPLLVFNEPNNKRDYGADLSPETAWHRYVVLRESYPQARLIVGGWTLDGTDWHDMTINWFDQFLAQFDQHGTPYPDYWHAHSYLEGHLTLEKAKANLTRFHERTGGSYWITEYGVLSGDIAQFQALTRWFMQQPWIERIAPYTNRQPKGASWAISDAVNLVTPLGKLSPLGQAYHDIIHSAA